MNILKDFIFDEHSIETSLNKWCENNSNSEYDLEYNVLQRYVFDNSSSSYAIVVKIKQCFTDKPYGYKQWHVAFYQDHYSFEYAEVFPKQTIEYNTEDHCDVKNIYDSKHKVRLRRDWCKKYL